jgi:hypothetical protein
LTVDVGDVDAVAVNNGEMMDAATHKALGAPAADAPMPNMMTRLAAIASNVASPTRRRTRLKMAFS